MHLKLLKVREKEKDANASSKNLVFTFSINITDEPIMILIMLMIKRQEIKNYTHPSSYLVYFHSKYSLRSDTCDRIDMIMMMINIVELL